MNARLAMAVRQYELVEQAELLLDRRNRDLREAVTGLSDEDMPEYVRLTAEITSKFAATRERVGL